MDECFRCGSSDEEVRLYDVIFNEGIVKICYYCQEKEELPLIKKPTTDQLKEAERPHPARERLYKAVGNSVPEVDPRIKSNPTYNKSNERVTLNDIVTRKIRSQTQPNAEREKPLDLIDNFHWVIMMARRNRHLTHLELSKELGESEEVLKMVEKGELPDDDLKIILKLENFFNLPLRKSTLQERKEREEKKERGDSDYQEEYNSLPQKALEMEKLKIEQNEKVNNMGLGSVEQRLEKRPEQNLKQSTTQNNSYSISGKKQPARIINFNPETMKNLTISDLKEMKRKRELVEKGLRGEKEKQPNRLEARRNMEKLETKMNIERSLELEEHNPSLFLKEGNSVGETDNAASELINESVEPVKEKKRFFFFRRKEKVNPEEEEMKETIKKDMEDNAFWKAKDDKTNERPVRDKDLTEEDIKRLIWKGR